ncbi:MAG: NAD-dependent DNA ligase LigA [Bacteroidales bacterium]
MLTENIHQRILQLRAELNRHNYLYYVLSTPAINDYEYDKLLKELSALEVQFPEYDDPDSPTKRVGSDLAAEFNQVRHRFPMLSLANTYSEEEVRDFEGRVFRALGTTPEYVCELKYDGVAIGLTYQNGKLYRAVTRGDGTVGDDVTANVRTIKSIPLVLQGSDYPADFEIRGEIFMPRGVFEELNRDREEDGETPFANPRNAASGTLKMQNSAIVAKRKLDCFLYFVLGDALPYDNHYQNLMAAKRWGFKISDHIKLCSSSAEVMEYIHYWDNARKKLPFDTDGIVVKVNSYQYQSMLGLTAKTPRWAFAFKFKPERVSTVLLSVDFQVGRTGAVTPVANLKPVKLAGTVVKRASLHNADQVELLDVRIGDTVYVEKGGEIIPKIVGTDRSQRTPFSVPLVFPENCPECGSKLFKPEGEARHFCLNQYGCPPQIKGRIEHFTSRKALNIDGLGEETVALLYDNNLVKDPADLYSLTREQLLQLERFAQKSADNAIRSIKESTEVPFPRVLYGLGIRYVGETTARMLALHFGNIDSLAKASFEELLAVDEVGERIAQSIIDFFANPVNVQLIDRLKVAGVTMKISPLEQTAKSDKLEGLSVVISGTFSTISREALKGLIQQHGGKVVSGVSASTSMLVAGDKIGPAKLEKASKLGIQIVSEEDFFELIKE